MLDHLATLHVAAAIIEQNGLILACRRNHDRVLGGKWEFPGGKLEPGESPGQALVREIREELGVHVVVTGELTTDDTIVGDQIIRLICLRAELLGPRPTNSTDHDALRWVDREQLPGLDWADADLPAVGLLANGATA
ncbi:(deoxy)nucleoside triphosphate pyrophosphohydrolase [Subtercola sp. YIM 133946]|uniref:(deoxy)nucleoside triphosphate pyrophosphohydrolase n=1 Tax=Subtercola sp. YIM 133946 TaxID=3118909 RepID=UPI002F927276